MGRTPKTEYVYGPYFSFEKLKRTHPEYSAEDRALKAMEFSYSNDRTKYPIARGINVKTNAVADAVATLASSYDLEELQERIPDIEVPKGYEVVLDEYLEPPAIVRVTHWITE